MTKMPLVAAADCFRDERELFELIFAERFQTILVDSESAARAAEEIAQLQPDIVLTRILPVRFGVELTRRLKADPSTRHIPILVITSLTDPQAHAQVRDAGASELLLLPVPPDVLVSTMLELLIGNPLARKAANLSGETV